MFTDGACRGNLAKAAGGAFRFGEAEKELHGGEASRLITRWNDGGNHVRIKTLSCVITTDSKYVLSGITEWMPNWKAELKTPVKNRCSTQNSGRLDALASV